MVHLGEDERFSEFSNDTEINNSTHVFPEENHWGWITLYVVTILIAILGNLLFIIKSLRRQRAKSTPHSLLINLSVRKGIKKGHLRFYGTISFRDILLSMICLPAALDYEVIHRTWNFSFQYCITYRSTYILRHGKIFCKNI